VATPRAAARGLSALFQRRRNRHRARHAYRRLANALALQAEDGVKARGRVVGITSPRGTRELFVAVRELGRFLAEEQDLTILLVDALPLDSRLSASLGHRRSIGLSDLANAENVELERYVVATGQAGVELLPAGRLTRLSSGAARGETIECIIELARNRYDYVLIACPPILDDSTALVLPAVVDHMVILAVEGRTRVDEVDEARDTLIACRARKVGIALVSPSRWGFLRALWPW